MPSKRMVPEQEVSELSDEMVRLAAAKDAEIAALAADRDNSNMLLDACRYERNVLLKICAERSDEIATLTEQRDRAMGALREPSESEIDAAWMAYRTFKCQADSNREHIRAALVAAYAVALAALDAEAAAETEDSRDE